ncbi:D52 family tumor protein [Serratia liquefaciens]|uniref:D52 family tumor protein n=1 Tax=Serratia liquefaciens TaxID=614 RepID=UPI0021C5B115|nr:D52 family tumor protein [Serratia liquefaciens]
MADPASLAAFTGTIELVNKTVDLVRNLRQKGDQELTAAEMRHTLIELLGDLVELKSEVVTLKAVLLAKEEEVTELRSLLVDKKSFKFEVGVYWNEGDDTPFCPQCYENSSKKIHLKKYDFNSWFCSICGSSAEFP